MQTDTIIVGAGPYGLSLAAKLRGAGVEHRIFGTPMQTWANTMPRGMHLKSEGFASNLYGPAKSLTLRDYCAREGITYGDTGKPVALSTFVSYGRAFAQALVPHLEQKDVAHVAPMRGGGYEVVLADGERCQARRVVVAAGVSHFAHLPECLMTLAPALGGHASRFTEPKTFAGKRVTVVGGGASALDMAALLIENGAQVDMVMRRQKPFFLGPPELRARSLAERIRAPQSGLGPGWKSRIATDAPLVFQRMPEKFRILVARKHLGPAGCWWTRAPIEKNATLHTGVALAGAEEARGGVTLDLVDGTGTRTRIDTDHVIAATGYKPELARLTFLAPELRNLRTVSGAPKLSSNFESSAPGLYFMGLASVYEFGPLVRFAFGADFSSTRLSGHLAARARKVRPAPMASASGAKVAVA